ncbi:MAG TPA: putative sulfate exporter family transporter [Gaiellales bacterium]
MRLLPGLALVAALVGAAILLNLAVTQVSILIFAIGLGVLLAPLAAKRADLSPGVAFAARPLLRAGVALLGLRISLHAVSSLGARGVAVAVGVVVITLLVTIVLGRMLGVEPSLAILIGTGSAICGASAIAAMQGVARADEDSVGYAIGTVTLFGSVAMLTLPYVFVPAFGISDHLGGLWAGASIHEVAQVAAAGAAISPAALKVAALMKLTRVVLLAPTVAIAAWLRGGKDPARTGRSLPVPGFVLAFLALVVVRSAIDVPSIVLRIDNWAVTCLLGGALAALGLRTTLASFRAAGGRPLVLGLAAWITALLVSLGLLVALQA